MTVALLITAVWLALGIGVIVLYNVVKSQYAPRGDLGATPNDRPTTMDPIRHRVHLHRQ